ncbi:SDR family oxidoreductase [Rhodococcus sp. NPDC057135]|uniref:SDR family oxidoreductase n=1 Tax=Rhodococcus sp. NPDC057135 TaxID=3346028 RepID=UPI003630948F
MSEHTACSSERHGRVILVTGASRGVGAETARILGQSGATVVVNFREKAKRAETIVSEITAAGGSAWAVRADLTDEAEVDDMFEEIERRYGALDSIVLNASGGLELGAASDYAMTLNRDAQISLADRASIHLRRGGRIVFVTSHQSHFYGQRPVPKQYEPIARSKRAGEDALRGRIPNLNNRGIRLAVVSGDMIEGTTVVTLLARREPDLVDQRRELAGSLPTIREFATAVALATESTEPSGTTVYVGGADYVAGPPCNFS